MRTDVRSRLWVALAVMAASLCLQAQTTKPRFEVASVRPAARTVDLRADPRWVRPGGAFSVTRTTVVNLMPYAYGLKTYQIIGGPDWMRGDVFAIDARAGREVTEDEAKAMLQLLLEDRFKLVFHMEQRDMRFRALVLANADGRLGPFMKRMETCTPEAQAEARKQFPPRTVDPNYSGENMNGSCMELTFMELTLTQWSDIPVLDKTGLNGKFT